jgi:hypothetical protein
MEVLKQDWGQFHQHFTRAFFVRKFFERSFFVLAVKAKLFSCARILAQLRQYNVGEIDSWWGQSRAN